MNSPRMLAVVVLELAASALAYGGLGLVYLSEACGKASRWFDPRPIGRR